MLFCVASALDETGLFIFDSNTKKLYQSHSNETTKLELGDQDFIQHCRYDSVRNEAITTFSFSDGTYEIHRQRPYYCDELSPLLISAGLHIVHLFSWFDMIPYSSETAKLFCVAEKRRQAIISHWVPAIVTIWRSVHHLQKSAPDFTPEGQAWNCGIKKGRSWINTSIVTIEYAVTARQWKH